MTELLYRLHCPPLRRAPWVIAPSLGLVLALAALHPAHAQATSERIVGYVRDANTQRYLYTEVHQLQIGRDGAPVTGTTTYLDPQGQEMARKTVDYRSHRTVPVYRLELPAQGYSEGITEVGGTVMMFKTSQRTRQEERLDMPEGHVAGDSGFNQLIMDLWPSLQRGQTVRFRLLVAGRLSDYAFRARHAGELTYLQQAATRIRVEPDSMLRFLVDPIDLIYDRSGRRLLHYAGVSNILNPATGEVYKRIDIQYGGEPPAEARLP
ncbi:hypothetical protein WNB94_11780 [Aquabacterium sp. A3]|uniref:hypothetical protein n=1 Tax=Aquabacterium sp. A3 TaxID=3132829 RepID=UPI00311A1865